MKIQDRELNLLQKEIDHILDSGANSIRLLNMFEEFVDRHEEKFIFSKPLLADSKTIFHRCSCKEGNPVEVKICLNCDGILK